MFQRPGEELVLTIGLGNHSVTACTLQGIPQVRLFGTHGTPIPTMSYRFAPTTVTRIILLPRRGRIHPYDLRPDQAQVSLYWHLADGAGACTPPARIATAARLVLPDRSGTLLIGGLVIAPCHGLLGISPFYGKEARMGGG